MEKKEITTFSINDFKAALAKKGMTQKDLSDYLNLAETTITKKVKDGDFTAREIRKMISLFGKDETFNFMFNESEI